MSKPSLSHLSIEAMQNGFLRLTDRRAAQSALYNADGSYRSGAPNSADYREAVRRFLAGQF